MKVGGGGTIWMGRECIFRTCEWRRRSFASVPDPPAGKRCRRAPLRRLEIRSCEHLWPDWMMVGSFVVFGR